MPTTISFLLLMFVLENSSAIPILEDYMLEFANADKENRNEGPPALLQARKKICLVKDNWDRLLVIHYACEGFQGDLGRPGHIYYIAVKDLATNTVHSFDKETWGTELDLLNAFVRFVDEHPDRPWVHWNMRDAMYGFEAIERQHRYIGGEPSRVSPEERIDLAAILYGIYGADFVPNPKLLNLVRLNGISDRGFLGGQEEARTGAEGKHGLVMASTLRKVEVIEELLRRLLEGTLNVGDAAVSPPPNVGGDPRILPSRQQISERPVGAKGLESYVSGCPEWTKAAIRIAKAVHHLLRRRGLPEYFAQQIRNAAAHSQEAFDARGCHELPLPIPGRKVSLAEKFVVLAAIYDSFWKGEEAVGPQSEDPEDWESNWYSRLRELSLDLKEIDAPIIRNWLEDVKEEIDQLDPKTLRKPRKRGPKGPRYSVSEDRKIHNAWKASGYSTLEDFAMKHYGDDSRSMIENIRHAIDRERKRRSREVYE